MTTFMAKLLQKLTEMSVRYANNFIKEQNDLLKAISSDEHKLKGQFESKLNQEVPASFA